MILLRTFTLIASVLLVFSLATLIVRLRDVPSRALKSAWLLVSGVQGVLLINYGAVELYGLLQRWSGQSDLRESGRTLYHSAYLVNGLVDAVLPAALMVLCFTTRRGRRVGLLLATGIFTVGIAAAARGALRDWQVLLGWSQIVSFMGVAGYLTFCALFILRRLPTWIDPYLASFIAVTTVYNLVLPIQEVLFQIVGKEMTASLWYVNQFLQVADSSAKLAIVLACIRSVRRETAASAPRAVVEW